MASLVAARVVRALVRLGWNIARQTGSHIVLVRNGRNPVTVPNHKGKTLKEGTARAILKQVGIGEDDFFDVY